jgi:hypothetical protein
VRLIDLRQAGVDDLLVELLLFLELEHLRGLLGQHVHDAVEHGIVQVRVVDRDGLDRLAQRLAQREGGLQPGERLGAAVDGHDDAAAGLVAYLSPAVPAQLRRDGRGILDDEHVGLDAADDALAHAAEHAVAHSSQPQGTDHDEVVAALLDVLDDDLPVLAVVHLRLERHAGTPAPLLHDHQVRVGDQLQPHGDQRVVDPALLLHLALDQVLLRQGELHLLEPVVVHACRVGMAPHQGGVEVLAQCNSQVDAGHRVLRVVDGDEDGLVHGPSGELLCAWAVERKRGQQVLVE